MIERSKMGLFNSFTIYYLAAFSRAANTLDNDHCLQSIQPTLRTFPIMRLSLAFVLSLALAQATEQDPIRQRQVRRNDTDEPQRIKTLGREQKQDKKKSKDKETAEVDDSKRKDKKDKKTSTSESSEGKKSKKKGGSVEGTDKKKNKKDGSKREEKKETGKKAKDVSGKTKRDAKKEKRSGGSQTDLKKKLEDIEEFESQLGKVTIDLGDILAKAEDKEEDGKKAETKNKREEAKEETVKVVIVESPPSAEVEEVETKTDPTWIEEGGRHKHVGHGRKKQGRGPRTGGGGQKLQGNVAGKSGKDDDDIARFQDDVYGKSGKDDDDFARIQDDVYGKSGKDEGITLMKRNRAGRNKTKTRGSGKRRTGGGRKHSNKKKTSRMSSRGAVAASSKAYKL